MNPNRDDRDRKGEALEAEERLRPADNHPGAQGATPPESGGELLKTLPSSDEEGWRAERRGGADKGINRLQRLKPSFAVSRFGGALQLAEKPFHAVILSAAKDLALSVFMAVRDSSSPAAPQNDSADGFFRNRLRRLRPRFTVSCSGGAEAPPFQEQAQKRVARTCFPGPRPFGRVAKKSRRP